MKKSRPVSRKPTGPAKLPICDHNNKSFKCATLQLEDVQSFHQSFYSNLNKVDQDKFLLTCIKTKAVEEHRAKKGTPSERSSKYFIKNSGKVEVPVCLNTFIHVLNVSRFRINRITRQNFFGGQIKENRGGFRNRKTFEDKTKSVFEFLEKLQCIEAHYCCDRKLRKYLPSELNIVKLYRIYLEDNEIDESDAVKRSYFHHIFRTKFNFSFGSPRTDGCITCLAYKKKLKDEKDCSRKDYLQTELYVHEMRAKAFFNFLESPASGEYGAEALDDTLILSFDFEKNLQVLRIPDTEMYYSRNVYLYNFTIVQGYSSLPLTPDNVASYCWTENEYPKNANTIASCILYHLNHTDLMPYTHVRLMVDGCAALRKNAIIVTALLKWLNESTDIVDIELIFPIRGHTFTPPNNLFTQIEREVSKKETIVHPDEYLDMIAEFATVRKVGADVPVLDVAAVTDAVIKPCSEWPFPVARTKRIVLRKSGLSVEMKGEMFYTGNMAPFSTDYCKVGKSLRRLRFETVEEVNVISMEKKVDLENLLAKNFGFDWRALPSLSFFVYLLDVTIISDPDQIDDESADESDSEAICCLVEEDVNVIL